MSQTTTRPPGRRARWISASATAGSAIYSSTCTHSARSTPSTQSRRRTATIGGMADGEAAEREMLAAEVSELRAKMSIPLP